MVDEKETKLIKVQGEVRNLVVLSTDPKALEEAVEISKKITVPDLSNKDQVALAKGMKIKLRKLQIDIEKEGKSYRDFFNVINKEIGVSESKLKSIVSSEIVRLADIEEEAKKLDILEKRKALIPVRLERLGEISKVRSYLSTDEELLEMDADTFEKHYNFCVSTENEHLRQEVEKEADIKRQEESDKLAKEMFKFRCERLLSTGLKEQTDRFGFWLGDIGISEEDIRNDGRIAFERKFDNIQSQVIAKKHEEEEIQKREARRIQLPTRIGKLEGIGDNIAVSEEVLLGMDGNEFDKYFNSRVSDKNNADIKVIEDGKIADQKKIDDKKKLEQEAEDEKKRIAEEEAKNKLELEKKEAFVVFLKKHGWTTETRGQFETKEIEGGYELWQKVGVFNN